MVVLFRRRYIDKIDTSSDFKYIGIIFSRIGTSIKHNVEQARKAIRVPLKRIRNIKIPIDLQLNLFDHVILPVALNSCEIWGFENSQIIENLHDDFLRQIVCLRKSTPIYI